MLKVLHYVNSIRCNHLHPRFMNAYMLRSTANCLQRRGKIMREFEFSRDELVLTKDDAWRRLFALVSPDIRRDIIGWLGLGKFQQDAEAVAQNLESASDRWRDVVVGASLVLDQLPNRTYEYCENDREALASDSQAVSIDAKAIHDVLFYMSEWNHQSERRATQGSAAVGRASKVAAE